MSKLGECLSDEELDMMINEADTNKNGEIEYEGDISLYLSLSVCHTYNTYVYEPKYAT